MIPLHKFQITQMSVKCPVLDVGVGGGAGWMMEESCGNWVRQQRQWRGCKGELRAHYPQLRVIY